MALARKLTAKIHEIKAHSIKVTCLDLGETGRVLVTGGCDRNVNLWAIGEKTCFMSLTGHNASLDCVKFAYNDDFVYSADDIGIIRRWDLNAQTMCSTLNGHMKSVRALDFNPSGEYVVSGSNDTTVRLWDVRNQNKCIKKYRGHVAGVNSVKFSPDGLWIASAGSEGSIVIWDIRENKQIMQFTERSSPVTCIQFHPFEFLLAAGRSDGSMCLYDLESNQLVTKTDITSPFRGYAVKCITFSESGECLFGGTSEGISVIGWEPDREFDFIASSWTALGDMKIVNKKLICGSYENEIVAVHALSIDRVIPFYNPSNAPFSHSQSSRKSFSKGNQKLRISIGSKSPLKSHDENTENCPTIDGGQSSPNLSIEMVDDIEDNSNIHKNSPLQKYVANKGIDLCNFSEETTHTSSKENYFDGPSSLKAPGEREIYNFNKHAQLFKSDLGCYPMENNSLIISNYVELENEVFQVNNAQQPAYAPKMETVPIKATNKTKTATQIQRRHSPPRSLAKTGFQRKISSVSSYSTMDLHKMDENLLSKKQSTGASRIRKSESCSQYNKENNAKNRNISVQIITKPPLRSRTTLDLKSARTAPAPINNSKIIPFQTDDSTEIQLLSSYHDKIYQELSNRHATLLLIRNSTRSQDVVGALKQAIKISGRSVFVDLLGAILEKTSNWNLDMCLLLLPEIYELLQSQHKFHYNRACDTLRVILSNFLPTIKENVDPWSPANSLGVDITREERQRKCTECHQWLLRIRLLPEQSDMGSALTQLQNIIGDI